MRRLCLALVLSLLFVTGCHKFNGWPRGSRTSATPDDPGGVASTVGTPDLTNAAFDTITDDFEDDVLDASLWEVRTWFAFSAAEETDGVLNLTRRPYFLTRDDWIPQGGMPLAVEFDWQFTNAVNNLTVVLRSDGERRDDQFAEVANGVSVHFSGESDNVRVILEIAGDGAEVTGGGEFPNYIPLVLSPGTTYRVRIIDTGSEVSVFVDDLDTPLLVAEVDTSFTVNRIAFFNREIDTGTDRIDNVEISGLRSVTAE